MFQFFLALPAPPLAELRRRRAGSAPVRVQNSAQNRFEHRSVIATKCNLVWPKTTWSRRRRLTVPVKVRSGTVNKPNVQTMAKIAKALTASMEELFK